MEILTKKCSKCRLVKTICDFYADRSKNSGLGSTCKECAKKRSKKQRTSNPEKSRASNASYYKNNTAECKENTRTYQNRKRKEDPMFRFKSNMRTRIWKFFNKISRSKSTQELLGCSWQQARDHVERQFKPGMSWENYGKWHVDHIVPLASASTIKEVEHLCLYGNLQPLWAIDNFKKSDKYGNS